MKYHLLSLFWALAVCLVQARLAPRSLVKERQLSFDPSELPQCASKFAIEESDFAQEGLCIPLEGERRLITSSPFDPPKANDFTFIVNSAGDLDTGCTFKNSGPLIFQIKIQRVIGDVAKLKSSGILSSEAILSMPAFDVDRQGSPPPEENLVTFNGRTLDLLDGEDGVWRLNTFRIPVEWINFATDSGNDGVEPEEGVNTIRIDIDTASSTPRWCTAIDWAALEINEVPYPVIFAHGILSESDIWQKVWENGLDDLGIPYGKDLDLGELDSISNNAGLIATEVAEVKKRFGVEKVTIVAHSKGGLDSREYIERNNDVHHLIQLGSPNAGSNLANVIQAGSLAAFGAVPTVLVNAFATPAGYQLTTFFMNGYNSRNRGNFNTRYTSVAGIYDPDCFVLNIFCKPIERVLLAITGEGDTIVSKESAWALPYAEHIPFTSSGDDKSATHSGLHQSKRLYSMLQGRVSSTRRRSLQTTSELPNPVELQSSSFGGTLGAGSSITENFLADSPVETTVLLNFAEGDNLDISILTPSGLTVDPTEAASNPDYGYGVSDFFGGKLAAYGFIAEVGQYQITVVNNGSGDADYLVTSISFNPEIKLEVSLASNTVLFGESLTYFAEISDSVGGVTGATVEALVETQGGSALSGITLLDDGVSPDLVAGDGIYSGSFATTIPGIYRATVTAEGTSPAFSREAFIPATAAASASFLTGIFSDSLIENNGNAFFDELRIFAECNVDISGTYRLFAELTDSVGNTIAASVDVPLVPGIQSVAIDFDGATIFGNGINGPFILSDIGLSDETGAIISELTDAYSTPDYSFNLFERDAFRLTGSSSFSVPSPSVLLVEIEVETDTPTVYIYSAVLRDKFGTEIGFFASSVFLPSGISTLSFTFDGSAIGANGVEGPFSIADFLASGGGRSIASPSSVLEIDVPVSSFGGYVPPTVLVTGNGVSTGVDEDNNGKNDFLVVDLGVVTDRPEIYDFSVSLVASNDEVIESLSGNISVDNGATSLRFVFDGTIIGAAGVPGPYCVQNLQLTTLSGNPVAITDACFQISLSVQDFEGYVSSQSGGDPHFSRWNHVRESFQGECDLVMVHAETSGFDLHARTTIQRDSSYSYIDSAALRFMDTVVEMQKDSFVVDGVKHSYKESLPFSQGTVNIVQTVEKQGKQVFEVSFPGAVLEFKFYKHFLSVRIHGNSAILGDATGILGQFPTGHMYNRAGENVEGHYTFTDHAFEWQVNPDDVQLFQVAREPQLPYERCRLPAVDTTSQRRHLREDTTLLQAAQRACGEKLKGSDFQLCVDDVMVTGDIGLAEEGW